MKGSSMNTHMGNITIDNEVIAQYAGTVAMECFGIVGMAGFSAKDGIAKLLKKDSLTRGIAVSLNNNKLTLKVRHDEQNAIDKAVAGAFAFRQLTKYLLLDGSDY